MTEATIQVPTKSALKEQIEQFTGYDKELTPGSGAKAVMKEVGASSRDLYQVPIDKLRVEPGLNPRVQDRAYLEGIEVLAEDILNNGFYQDKPLSGYIAKSDGADVIVVIDGHRRFAAAKRAAAKGAQLEALPVVLKDKSIGMAGLTLALLHSNEGQPFTVYEKAVIAKRLKSYGWENGRIAAEMRCTPAFVGQLLDLAGAPQAIQTMVQAGVLSATEAQKLVKEHGEDAVEVATEAASRAKAEGRTRVTAKDITPKERKEKLARKHGFELYQAVLKLLKNDKVTKAMSNDEHAKIDGVLELIEAKPKEPKPKKEKAPAKKAAAKKSGTPIAKKIATVSKKSAAKAEGPSGGAEFFNKLDQQQAERKAGTAQARGARRTGRYSERVGRH